MRDILNTISTLIDELKQSFPSDEDRQFVANFDAFEIPDLVCQVVDYLQPILTTYEAAIYWYMFRHSILRDGGQYARVSVRGMGNGVVLSSSGQSKSLSYSSVQKALQSLEEKGAISKAGEPNREGTPYKIYLPEEIQTCRDLIDEQKRKALPGITLEKDLDFYNNKENRVKVFERDSYCCHYCKKQLTRFTTTLDHLQPVSQGGDNSFDNLTTSCLHCNSSRGSQPLSEFISKIDT